MILAVLPVVFNRDSMSVPFRRSILRMFKKTGLRLSSEFISEMSPCIIF
jgi:hypothetical protein